MTEYIGEGRKKEQAKEVIFSRFENGWERIPPKKGGKKGSSISLRDASGNP